MVERDEDMVAQARRPVREMRMEDVMPARPRPVREMRMEDVIPARPVRPPASRAPGLGPDAAAGEPDRARVVASLRRYIQDYRDNFISQVEDVASRNPSIRPEVFQAIVDEHMRQLPAMEAEMLRAYDENPPGGRGQAQAMQQEMARIRARFGRELQDKISRDHGEPGIRAMQDITREMQPKGFFSGIVKHFFNSNRGGVQWGAVGGAAAGGILGYLLGGKLGGIMSVLAPVIGAGIMSYIGSSLADSRQDTPRVRPDFHSRHRTREPARPREPVRPGRGGGVLVDATQPAGEPSTTMPDNVDELLSQPTVVASDGDARSRNIRGDLAPPGPRTVG